MVQLFHSHLKKCNRSCWPLQDSLLVKKIFRNCWNLWKAYFHFLRENDTSKEYPASSKLISCLSYVRSSLTMMTSVFIRWPGWVSGYSTHWCNPALFDGQDEGLIYANIRWFNSNLSHKVRFQKPAFRLG